MILTVTLLLVLFADAHAKSAQVYGIFTGFSNAQTSTVVYGAQIDSATGHVADLSTNFIYAGSSGTFDGISCFDQQRGVFYWVTDFADSYVYSVSTTSGALQPTIALEDNGILSVHFDYINGRLVAVDVVTQPSTAYYITILPINPNTSPAQRYAFPPTLKPGFATAFDAERQILFSYDGTSLSEISISSSGVNVTNEVTVQCTGGGISKLWLERPQSIFDSNVWGLRQLLGNNSLVYYLVNIHRKTGACQSIAVPATGIVTASSVDMYSGTLFYLDATNAGSFLRTVNIRSGTETSIQLDQSMPMSDIAVRYVK